MDLARVLTHQDLYLKHPSEPWKCLRSRRGINDPSQTAMSDDTDDKKNRQHGAEPAPHLANRRQSHVQPRAASFAASGTRETHH